MSKSESKAFKKSRFFGIFVLGGLTTIAAKACWWQRSRYYESEARWNRINEQIEAFETIDVDKLHFFDDNGNNGVLPKESEYTLVKGKGILGKDTIEVMRGHNGVVGSYLMKPLFFSKPIKSAYDGILIKVGWLPEYIDKSEVTFEEKKEIEIVGLLKRDEDAEVKRTTVFYPKMEGVHNLIDTKMILEDGDLGENSKFITKGYIELIEKSGEESNTNRRNKISTFSDNMYPLIPNSGSFEKPYLTPRKHFEYSTFWGGATMIGLTSMFIAIFKFK